MTTTLLIDGDMLAFKAAAVVEEEIDWGDGFFTLSSDLDEAKPIAERLIAKWLSATESDDVILTFTDSKNFRKDIYPEYKANRANVRKPMVLKPLIAWLSEHYHSFTRPTLEADDILGILATSRKLVPGRKIICAEDKDLLQIPGLHYNPRDEETGVFDVGLQTANLYFLSQVLTGDSSDNYPGCPGIGPVKAEKILTAVLEEGTPWATEEQIVAMSWLTILSTYATQMKQKLPSKVVEAAALRQARIARICRREDYDFKRKEVRLWNPPSP